MRYGKYSSMEDNIWYIALYQVMTAVDKHMIRYKNVEQIKDIYNGRIPAELYKKVFEGHVLASCFGSVYTFLSAHTPLSYKGQNITPSSVIEIIGVNGRSTFYMCDESDNVKVEFDTTNFFSKKEDEPYACVLSKDNVSFFYSSFYTMEQIKCKSIKVCKQMSKKGNSDYKVICKTVDGMELNFTFNELPALLLSNYMGDFQETDLYIVEERSGQKVLDKDNLDLVSTWLEEQGYLVERF